MIIYASPSCGKTTVTKELREQGICAIDTDELYEIFYSYCPVRYMAGVNKLTNVFHNYVASIGALSDVLVLTNRRRFGGEVRFCRPDSESTIRHSPRLAEVRGLTILAEAPRDGDIILRDGEYIKDRSEFQEVVSTIKALPPRPLSKIDADLQDLLITTIKEAKFDINNADMPSEREKRIKEALAEKRKQENSKPVVGSV